MLNITSLMMNCIQVHLQNFSKIDSKKLSTMLKEKLKYNKCEAAVWD